MIPVDTKVVISVDMSREVSAENNARLRDDKYPMEDAEIRKFVKERMKEEFGPQSKKLDGLLSVQTFVGRAGNSRFGDMTPVLRQRLGLGADDTSRDAEIEKYSSEQALRECCQWYLNYPEWADSFIKMAGHCGFIMEPIFE